MSHVRTIQGENGDGPVVVTVGSFDGVHVGHQGILRRVVRTAGGHGTSTVVSFDPHPRQLLGGHGPPALTTLEERASLCLEAGIDRFAVIEFDAVVAGMTPEEYVRDILIGELGASVVVVGHDHRFGQGAAGDVGLLTEIGTEAGLEVVRVDAVVVGDEAVSSSRIRGMIEAGRVKDAAELLGRPYSVTGTVGPGDGRGKSIGYPTANLTSMSADKMSPAEGVYAVLVSGERLRGMKGGMMNIGTRPTFDGTDRHLEVHIFDVDVDLYHSELRVEFARRIRAERKFGSVDALVSQLKRDEVRCRAALSNQGVHPRR